MNFAWLSHPAILVGLGGAAGCNARYWLGRWFQAQPWAKDYFWGTFVINVTGSMLLGVIAAVFKDRAGMGFLLLGSGFCGGYTTFSTFSLEMAEFVQRGRWDLAFIYVLSSVALGFLGFVAMWAIVRGNEA